MIWRNIEIVLDSGRSEKQERTAVEEEQRMKKSSLDRKAFGEGMRDGVPIGLG